MLFSWTTEGFRTSAESQSPGDRTGAESGFQSKDRAAVWLGGGDGRVKSAYRLHPVNQSRKTTQPLATVQKGFASRVERSCILNRNLHLQARAVAGSRFQQQVGAQRTGAALQAGRAHPQQIQLIQRIGAAE